MTTRTKGTKTTIATPTSTLTAATPAVSLAKPVAPQAVAPEASAPKASAPKVSAKKNPVKSIAAPSLPPAPGAVVIPMPLKPAVKATQAKAAARPLAKAKAKPAPKTAAGRTAASATTRKRAAAPVARKAAVKPVGGKLKVAAAAVKPAGRLARKKK